MRANGAGDRAPQRLDSPRALTGLRSVPRAGVQGCSVDDRRASLSVTVRCRDRSACVEQAQDHHQLKWRRHLLQLGYCITMTEHPQQPESDEADREKESTPAGVAHDLEALADETGATTDAEEVNGSRDA